MKPKSVINEASHPTQNTIAGIASTVKTLLLLWLLIPAAAQAEDYIWADNGDGTCTITDYTGPGGNITIPDTLDDLTVTVIGYRAFDGCTSLTGVVIPGSVTTIGDFALFDCANLASINIGTGVIDIGDDAFSYCANITNITVAKGNPVFLDVNGTLFNKNQTELIRYPSRKTGTYIIPSSVTSIRGGAFSCCSNLINIIVGDGVTSIGEWTFECCTNLGVYFRGNAPVIGTTAFNRCVNVTVYYIPGTDGWGTYVQDTKTAEWPLSPADVDANYEVNLTDFAMLAAYWLQTDCDELNDGCQKTDVDQSGSVDPIDLIILADNWLGFP